MTNDSTVAPARATEDMHSPASPAGHTIEAVDAGTQPLRWSVLVKAGVKRISDILYDVIGAHTVENRASSLISDAQGLLYLLEAMPATDPTIYKENDGIHVVSILRAARDQLELAKSLHEGGMPLSGAESDAIAAAATMLHELMKAVEPAPGDMERLEAFANFKPAVPVKNAAPPQRPAAPEERAGNSEEVHEALAAIGRHAFDIEMLCGLSEHHAIEDYQRVAAVTAAAGLAQLIGAISCMARGGADASPLMLRTRLMRGAA